MIPRFIQEKLVCDSKKLVESFKQLENMKTETKQKLNVGDNIVCITDSYKDFTKGKEYDLKAVIRSFEMKNKKYIEQITKYYESL